jgi:hypothetical protein
MEKALSDEGLFYFRYVDPIGLMINWRAKLEIHETIFHCHHSYYFACCLPG